MSSTCLPLVRRCRHLLAAAVAATSLIVACGGGVDTGGTGAPAQSYSAGRISGFGSIIVNGVHFDESAASIVDQDGVSRSRSELKLGMIVDIEAGPVTVDPATKKARSVASKIQIRDEIKGPVESVNLATGTLVVLGQPIAIDLDTVFSGLPGGLAGVVAGQQLEVFAFHDPATGVHAATRIELKASQDEYELRGVPVWSTVTGPASMSTIMPSLSSLLECDTPSSSTMLAAASSKCTPLTMIEPKPEMRPAE